MPQIQSRLIDLSFPAELLLEVIQQVPFDRDTIPRLARIHPRFRTLLKHHQRSITKNLARRQLPHALTDFPCNDSTISYSWLAQCIRQYDVVDDVMAVLVSHLNCYAVEKHNMAVVNAGLLLLYRLQSFDAYADKITFIKSLYRDPLTAMFLAIHYSTLTARYHGEGIINRRKYGRFLDANQLELRNEIEFCFSEGALNMGPAFINDILNHIDENETTLHNLYHAHGTHDWDTETEEDLMPPITQGPQPNPEMKQRSLFTTLLERMAELIRCPLEEVVGSILEDTEIPDHSLAWLSLANKARLLKGLDLEYVDDTSNWCMARSGI